jgi:hypothetical protein
MSCFQFKLSLYQFDFGCFLAILISNNNIFGDGTPFAYIKDEITLNTEADDNDLFLELN